jgi:uncharacterized membrane protein YeaQ/YmgE (transglycosylase-associated protein family)
MLYISQLILGLVTGIIASRVKDPQGANGNYKNSAVDYDVP